MNQDFYKGLIDSLYDGVYYVDLDGQITFWNPAAEHITGYSASDVVGKRCSDNILRHVDDAGNELCLKGCPLKATLRDGQVRESEVYLHHKEGHRVPISVRVSPFRDELGQITGAMEIFSNNITRSRTMRELKEYSNLAFYDPLTDVGNRRFADMQLDSLQNNFERYAVPFGIQLVNIDNFSSVNDTHGNEVGDRILRMVGRTISNSLRSVDMVFRWGDNEFLVAMPNADVDVMKRVGERLRFLIEKSWIELNDNRDDILGVTVSIGGAMSGNSELLGDVLRRSEEAMHECKENGQNQVRIAE